MRGCCMNIFLKYERGRSVFAMVRTIAIAISILFLLFVIGRLFWGILFYDTTADIYEANSWHYSYANHNAINENVDYGKVLMLGDSYDCVIQPFLSLGIHETDFLLMRGLDDSFNLREFIDKNGYDTVIIGYAQFMIGAHDDPDSDNYRMFKFD